MTKILIPRSDSISVKTIEPSDFESYFSSDFLNDYVKTGFTLSAGTGLAVNIATGQARLKGLFINSTATETKGSLTANNTNYIYITLARDINSEAESWDFTSNTTGTTPTDSLFIGTATTDASSVTAVDMSNVLTKTVPVDYFGDGSDGAATISTATTLANSESIKQYTTLTVNAGQTLTCGTAGSVKHWILFATEKITINGTIDLDGKGGLGGAGGAGGSGGAGGAGSTNTTTATGKDGSDGQAGKGGNGYNGTGGNGTAGQNGASGGGNSGGGGSASGGGGGTSPSPNTGINLGDTDTNLFTTIVLAFSNVSNWGTGGTGGSGGAGGGGGAGAHANGAGSGGSGGAGGAGGTGGAGGGCIFLVAPEIVFGSNASITCQGVAGTIGSNGSDGSSAGFNQHFTAGGTGGIAGGASPTSGSNNTAPNTYGASGGGGGAGGSGGTGEDGFIAVIGYNVPSQSELNSKGTAQVKVRLEF